MSASATEGSAAESGTGIDEVIAKLLEVRGSRPGKQVNLTEAEIRGLCTQAREIFMAQPVLLELEAPIKICGARSRPHTARCARALFAEPDPSRALARASDPDLTATSPPGSVRRRPAWPVL